MLRQKIVQRRAANLVEICSLARALDDVTRGASRSMDVILEHKLDPSRVVIDHVNEETVKEMKDRGFWAAFSIYPHRAARRPDPAGGGTAGPDQAREIASKSLDLIRDLERAMGIEPTTRSLGSYCSTTELHPRPARVLSWRAEAEKRGFTSG
jgi:hypothetical protein